MKWIEVSVTTAAPPENTTAYFSVPISEIKKKTWPELFKKILEGKKNSDVRLADFDIKEGDTLVFEEYDPKTKKYTSRIIKKKIKNLTKLNLTDFNSFEDFKKYGHCNLKKRRT